MKTTLLSEPLFERAQPPIRSRLPLGRKSARRRNRWMAAGVAALGASFLPGLTGSSGAVASAAPAPTAAALSAAVSQAAPAPAPVSARLGAALSTSPIVGVAPAGTSGGYWMAAANGGVFAFGKAPFYGSLSAVHLARPIVGIASTPDGGGYWLVASDGGVFSFGDARFHGSTGGIRLSKPIVGMASTSDDGGYWLVASDGGVFSFGDARFHGSTGGIQLHRPIVGMAAAPGGTGYWLVASDGGVFSFGTARFHGSTGAMPLDRPIVGMAATSNGSGYWLVASDGGVFNFGNAAYKGSAVAFNGGYASTVGIIPIGAGYWLPNNMGQVDNLGGPAPAVPSEPVVGPAPSALPASVNPSASSPPPAAYSQACWVSNPNIAACNAASLAAINAARAGEGYGPLPLPSNFYSLGVPGQLIAVANAERTSRGLPAMGQNLTLDSMAQAGAVSGNDPTGPSGYNWGSNIAWGDPTPLAADFGWMYDDGPNSENIDCPTASSPGCWGHRENILAPWGGEAGAGVYVNGGVVQLTQLFVDQY